MHTRLATSLSVTLLVLCLLAGQASAAGMLTFTFDDGIESVYKHAFAILKSRGQIATVGVIASKIDSGDPAFMTPAEALELQAAGWEIASHGMTHQRPSDIPRLYADEPVRRWAKLPQAPGVWQTRYRYQSVSILLDSQTELTPVDTFEELKKATNAYYFDDVICQLYIRLDGGQDPNTRDIRAGSYQRELEVSARELRDMGFKVTDYISPYNYWTEETLKLSRQYYKCVATGEGEPNEVSDFNAFDLTRVIVVSDTTAEDIIAELKHNAVAKNGWVILCLHGIEDNVGYEPWTAEKLDKVSEWAAKNGVSVVTLSEGLNRFQVKRAQLDATKLANSKAKAQPAKDIKPVSQVRK